MADILLKRQDKKAAFIFDAMDVNQSECPFPAIL
jgi:hypothetical protein